MGVKLYRKDLTFCRTYSLQFSNYIKLLISSAVIRWSDFITAVAEKTESGIHFNIVTF